MKTVYSKPILHDLSQGSRIAFARHFRLMTQDEIAKLLDVGGTCRRRTITRYERSERHPEVCRCKKIANILNVSYDAIKRYDFDNPIDILYMLLWMEELLPNYYFDISKVMEVNPDYIEIINNFLSEWNEMKIKRKKREIRYSDYIEWKLTYKIKDKEVSDE